MYPLDISDGVAYSDDRHLPPLVEPPTPIELLRDLQQQTHDFEHQLAALEASLAEGQEEPWDRATLDKFVREISRTESNTRGLLQALRATTLSEHGSPLEEHATRVTSNYKKYMTKLIERISLNPSTGSFGKRQGLRGIQSPRSPRPLSGARVLAEQDKIVIDVLIVDDDPLQAVMLEDMLTMCSNKDPDGFRFRTARVISAEQCLCKLRDPQYTCNIVFVDLIMPETSGFELLHSIRDLLGHTLTIVMNSAHAGRDLVMGCFQGGADLYISKPIHIRSLEDIWQLTLKRQPHLATAIAKATTSTASTSVTLDQDEAHEGLCNDNNACNQQ